MHFKNIKKTKILATLGPASASPKIVTALIKEGVNTFRINASHAGPKEVKSYTKLIRDAAKKLNMAVGILLDLQGPKIRLGLFENGKTTLKTGQKFILTTKTVMGTKEKATIGYKNFVKDSKIGDIVYLNDGQLKLKIIDKKDPDVHCKVLQGGLISSKKGVNLPYTVLSTSPVTEKDKKDALLAIENKLDFIALSFVAVSTDIQDLKTHLKSNGGAYLKIIAKIERPIALKNLEPIIHAADGVIVARGDLGVEIGVEKVPQVQKRIITMANQHVKPVIVATQMLESMITNLTATRAEVSDVANAIYDRCDAVMLSGETAMGIDPANAVKTMKKICLTADHDMEDEKKHHLTPKDMFETINPSTSLCIAADRIAEETKAKCIMAFTRTGRTALIASKLNSVIPVIGITDKIETYQQMALYRGIIPILISKNFDETPRWRDMIKIAETEAKNLKLVKRGYRVVTIAGIPFGKYKDPNSIRIISIA